MVVVVVFVVVGLENVWRRKIEERGGEW